MRSKKRTYPGSIFAQKGYLYINLKGKRYPTHLIDNKLGRERAKDYLELLWERSMDLESNVEKGILVKEAFQKFKEFKVNLFKKTLDNYEDGYNAIIKENYILNLEKIERDIQRYIRETKHSAVTINNYLRNLQIFLSYCHKKKWIAASTIKSDYKVNQEDSYPQVWKEEEIKSIIDYFDANKKHELVIMIKFMLTTGARTVDCLNLTPDDITETEIHFRNKKTKKLEKRPLSKNVKELLAELPKYSDRIFPWKYSTSSRLHKWLKDACEKLNIEMNKRSYQEFRITFRMKLLDAGTPEAYIQYLMRHKKQETTYEKYTKLQDNTEIMKYLEKVTV